MTFMYLQGSDSYLMDISYQIDDETQKILDTLYQEGDHPDRNSVNILLRQFQEAMPWCDHAEDLSNGFDESQSLFRVRLGINKPSALQHPMDIVDSFGKWFRRELMANRDGRIKSC